MLKEIADYDKVVQLDPKHPIAWNNRCWARALIGDLKPGLADCNQSLQLTPNDRLTYDSAD